MSNASFSSLIYRIIGKPDRWHDEYIVEVMQQYLDETDSFEEPFNFSEIAAGDQIISRIREGNVALNAFNALLDKSRFQMIILDEKLQVVYHNHNADNLFEFVKDPQNPQKIKPALQSLIRERPDVSLINKQNELLALDFQDEHGDQVYLRSIQSQVKEFSSPSLFHILMVLDKAHAHMQLNADLIAQYGLTEKEQNVLVSLIHGNSIKEIAESSFISEHTVKSHLKSIFHKTDTKSQAMLISLILTHESQVLDSYFESDITTATSTDNNENDREMVLASGDVIAYCEYGPKNGRPLIVFHSGFGSRLAVPPDYEEICQRTNRRVIIPDRPGLGKTAFIEGHPEQWNAQLQEFIDLLGIDKYEVLGSIIASQMAISYAAQADDRLQKLIITSPVFLNEPSHIDYLTEILAPAALYVRVSPLFAKEIYELWLKSVTLSLDTHYMSMLEESVGSAEREMFEEKGMLQLLTNVFKEGARQSLDGILAEMVFCLTPLGIDMEKLTVPMEVWYGTEDKRITQQGAEAIFQQFPNCELKICEGYSEHIYYALFEEIIA
ncbi:MAG: alpha/beta fold hydrolase [Pseudomonadota bacterium]